MSGGAPPLQFLALVLGGWVCVRAAFLSVEWLERQRPGDKAPPTLIAAAKVAPPGAPAAAGLGAAAMIQGSYTFAFYSRSVASRPDSGPQAMAAKTVGAVTSSPPASPVPIFTPAQPETVPGLSPLPVPQAPAGLSRWGGSAWLFVREGGSGQLAPGGTLGGSQIGGRLGYRLNGDIARPVTVSARFYSPTRDLDEAEAALGIEWQPSRTLPVRLLAERREAIGDEGRSAFAVMAYGGVSDRPVGPLRLEAYAQAGVVGLRSRDLFADGSARLMAPLATAPAIAIGAGLWGAAQPGVSRLDAGPAVSVRIAPNLRAVAEWRLRIAGDAAPGSGPALTVSTDF